MPTPLLYQVHIASFWNAIIDGIWHHVGAFAAGFLISALFAYERWYPAVRLFLRNIKRPQPAVNKLVSVIEGSKFDKHPKGERKCHYYARNEEEINREEPLYLFFANLGPHVKSLPHGVQVQRFFGFLIPPLDFGHGTDKQRMGLNFDSRWESYLTKIGVQAKSSKGKHFANRKYLFFRDEIEFEAKRIIFIDKSLLGLFIFNHKEIKRLARLSGREFEPVANISNATRFARSVLLYAYDIIRIHQITWDFREYIESVYIDESQVRASQYYDFGCYWIEGAPIVYNPIARLNDTKRIIEERVIVGVTARQLERIKEHSDDFEDLWTVGSDNCQTQHRMINRDKFRAVFHPDKECDSYYDLNYLIPEVFEYGYFEKLNEILLDKREVIAAGGGSDSDVELPEKAG
jgi:hypothetical protein